MLFRTVSARRSKSGSVIARKGIPEDVREDYQRLYGQRWEAKLSVPAGTPAEARGALVHLKEMHPALSVSWIEQNVPYTPGPMAKFLEGLRKAGLE
jgi:hypothetical protein